MQQKIKILLLLFAVITSFFFTSCETEELFIKKNSGEKSLRTIKHLKDDDARKVVDFLKKKLPMLRNNNLAMRTEEPLVIDFSKIIEVIDTLGVKNYTFKVVNHPEDNYKIFHNLVLTEKNNEFKAVLMEYEMGEVFAQDYNAGLKKFGEFEGKIKSVNLSSDTEPCEEEEINYPTNPSDNSGSGGFNAGDNTGSSGNVNDGSNGGGGSSEEFTQSVSLSFECSCGRSYSSWQSYAGSFCGDGSNPGYDLTIVVSYNRYGNSSNEENDPCNNDGDIGVLDPKEDDLCKQLDKIANSPGFADRIAFLKTKAAGDKEHAWAYKYFPNTTTFSSPTVVGHNTANPNTVNMDAFLGTEWLGAFHNHTSGETPTVKMFSPGDLSWFFLKAIKKNNNQPPSVTTAGINELFLGLVNVNEVYCLKIKDWNKFYELKNSVVFERFKTKLEKEYTEKGEEATQTTLQKILLKVLNEFDLGIGLYQQDENNNWSEINLDPTNNNNSPIKTPCP